MLVSDTKEFPANVAQQSQRIFMSLFPVGFVALFAQSPATIRVPVRLVTAPTLVFSNDGHLVPGLQTTDFRVFDNGYLQKATLETASTPLSVAIVVQANMDLRSYVPFIAKAGSMVDALLVGESGEAAVITYSDDICLQKPFDVADVQSTLRSISAKGKQARMIDAGLFAIAQLKERPNSRTRILLFIGQPMDDGSESSLSSLREQAEREAVTILALTLPMFGRAFVSDTFSLQGLPRERGGFKASVDLNNLVRVLGHSSAVNKGIDPFSVLTGATGGAQIPFRKQSEFENAIGAIGVELRSAYLLNYYPNSTATGYHAIQVEVNVPGAKVRSRPGYWLSDN